METLQVKRGDTLRRVFLFTDADGQAVDLSGCAARFAAKPKGEDTVAFYAPMEPVAPGDPMRATLTIDGPAGSIALFVSEDVMEGVEPMTYPADIEVTWPSGDVVSTETFQIKVIEDITT